MKLSWPFPDHYLQNSSLKEKVRALEKLNEESTGETLQFRQTLEKTVSNVIGYKELVTLPMTGFSPVQMTMLADLQTTVDSSNREHELELKQKETALQMVRGTIGMGKLPRERVERLETLPLAITTVISYCLPSDG